MNIDELDGQENLVGRVFQPVTNDGTGLHCPNLTFPDLACFQVAQVCSPQGLWGAVHFKSLSRLSETQPAKWRKNVR